MKRVKGILLRAVGIFLIFTILCGVVYTGVITGVAQVFFPNKANGSIIEVNGVSYGSALLGQRYTDNAHMWGRIMNVDVTTYKDDKGNPLLYSGPSNLSPESSTYKDLVAKRVQKIKQADPAMGDTPIPEDLLTNSGSGLDPSISIAAAQYQVNRVAQAKGISNQQVEQIIQKCTTNKLLGIFGERTVNVLRVNLMLDGVLK